MRRGRAVWQRAYGKRRALAFAIDGDETGHLLWRLAPLSRVRDQVEVAVLMIGTNNVAREPPQDIADGIVAVVDLLHKQLPRTHVVVLAIFHAARCRASVVVPSPAPAPSPSLGCAAARASRRSTSARASSGPAAASRAP